MSLRTKPYSFFGAISGENPKPDADWNPLLSAPWSVPESRLEADVCDYRSSNADTMSGPLPVLATGFSVERGFEQDEVDLLKFGRSGTPGIFDVLNPSGTVDWDGFVQATGGGEPFIT